MILTIKYHLIIQVGGSNRMVACRKTFGISDAVQQTSIFMFSWTDGYFRAFAATVLGGRLFAFARTPLGPAEKKLRS
ncbi:hypothetical protein CQY21_08650 [Mycolicibacterium boenickei]|nr:hypothetical protein CQY21_08650 [Mycolicibacterium boenickei]